MLGIIFRAQQPLFLGGDRKKQHGAARRSFHLRVGARDFEQRGAARRVVDRAVINLVAVAPVRAEMIPVRGVDHVLILQRRIAAGALGDHVVRLNGAQRIVNVDLRAHAQRHG